MVISELKSTVAGSRICRCGDGYQNIRSAVRCVSTSPRNVHKGGLVDQKLVTNKQTAVCSQIIGLFCSTATTYQYQWNHLASDKLQCDHSYAQRCRPRNHKYRTYPRNGYPPNTNHISLITLHNQGRGRAELRDRWFDVLQALLKT